MSEQIVHILAFESSCDDTSVAVVRARPTDQIPELLAWSVQSQFDVHSKFGGVVPELASRSHLMNLLPCLEKVLSESKCPLSEIDAFAATHRPGLIGCLLIGHTAAKTLSFLFQKPLLSCHHIESHLMSVALDGDPKFPFLAAVVSGGHTSLFILESWDEIREVGVTLDDALGEAFDKGAKLLGFGFQGGAAIDAAAKNGREDRIPFGKVNVPEFNFSFSGLKSELQRAVQRKPDGVSPEDFAASFQRALLDHLFQKMQRALESFQLKRIAIVGGVARNSLLRQRLENWKERGVIEDWYAPRPELCTDNAAMVGVKAFRKWKRNEVSTLADDVHSTSRPAVARRPR